MNESINIDLTYNIYLQDRSKSAVTDLCGVTKLGVLAQTLCKVSQAGGVKDAFLPSRGRH